MISSLDDRLQQLQATVAALVERTAGTAAAPMAEDPTTAAASRTLKMAEQTADATVADAKAEAAKLLASAREQHDSMLAAARQAAEAEFDAQRTAAATEAAAWETRKKGLIELFVRIETQLSECDGRLAEAHELVRAALDQPGLASALGAESAPAVEPEQVAPSPAQSALYEPPVVEAASSSTEAIAESTDEAEEAPKETVFGNPPAPVLNGPGQEEATTQAFYPWSGNSTPSAPASEDASATAAEAPAPPVQRRGLFGH